MFQGGNQVDQGHPVPGGLAQICVWEAIKPLLFLMPYLRGVCFCTR